MDYPKPSVTADCAIFALDSNSIRILLIQRRHDPFSGRWALPGGFLDIDEPLDHAAYRELKEETGLEGIELKRLGIYGDPGRDPRGRTITLLYTALLDKLPTGVAGADDASDARWFSLDDLPELAFDHAQIISDATRALRESLAVILRASEGFSKQLTLADLLSLQESLNNQHKNADDF